MSSINKAAVWTGGMVPPKGCRHPPSFLELIRDSDRAEVGVGTVENPNVTWIYELPPSEEAILETERIVKEEARRYGMSYVWIVMMGHDISTVGRTPRGRTFAHDDHHITVRMGRSPQICCLHGHLYCIYEDKTPEIQDHRSKILVPKRMMTDEERGIVGGRNPHLWVWGPYPNPSSQFPRAPFNYPKPPYQIKKGSILEKVVYSTD